MRVVRGVAQFIYDFLIGDDWKIAMAVAVAMTIGIVLVRTEAIATAVLTVLVGALLFAAFTVALLIDTRQ